MNHADLLMNTCDGRSSQSWLYSTGDRSLRSLGKCMEVAGNVRKAGSRVQLDSCTGASAQSWDLRVADRTIRTTSGLCLQPKAGSTALQATLEIATCKPGSAAQQWTW